MSCDGRRVVLVTFAGRQERMRLLIRYVRAAIAAGLIDEWHVWNVARKKEDADWLRRTFPLRRTGDSGTQHRFAKLIGSQLSKTKEFKVDVVARNDCTIALQPNDARGVPIEIVLGGWANRRS